MGLENVIRAMQTVFKKHPDTILLIGGKGSLGDELKKQAAEIDEVGRIRFLGYVKSEDVPKYYGISHASIVPTRELEGFGLVLLESLACGTPVLATPIGGMPEILQDFRKSWLFDDISSDAIARGIINFLDNGGAESERAECRNFVLENFTWGRMLDEVLAAVSVV